MLNELMCYYCCHANHILLFCPFLVKPRSLLLLTDIEITDRNILLNGLFFLFVICLPLEFYTRRYVDTILSTARAVTRNKRAELALR